MNKSTKPVNIYIRTSLVAPLIGKSRYNKDHETFMKLLNMNKNKIYSDVSEFDEILSTNNTEELTLINQDYHDVESLHSALVDVANFEQPNPFIEKCKKYMICNFGKLHESDVLEHYKRTNNLICNEEKLFRDMLIFQSKSFNIILTGTPDAITGNNEIIEIKNRIHSLSKEIKECDFVQLQTYLNIYGYETGQLVEGMIVDKDQIKVNVFEVKRDLELFEKIKNNLVKICILVFKLLTDEELYKTFILKNNIEKCQFIYQNLETINKMIVC